MSEPGEIDDDKTVYIQQMIPASALHKSVRNILFNELGIDKEYIERLIIERVTELMRQEKANIESIVAKARERLRNEYSSWVHKSVNDEADQVRRSSKYQFEKKIEDAIKETVDKIFRDNIRVTIKEFPFPEKPKDSRP